MTTRFKKLTALTLASMMCIGVVSVNAATVTKQASLLYQDVKVTFNGENKEASNEIFSLNGSVYVGVRDIGEMTGNTVNWDSATKTVQITSNNTISSTDMAMKNLEIAQLKNEVANLQKQIEVLEAQNDTTTNSGSSSSSSDSLVADITTRELETMVSDLNSDYKDELDIRWDFDLETDEQNDVLNVTATFKSSESDYYIELEDEDIEDFLLDVCADLRKEFGKINIAGQIVMKSTPVCSFTLSGTSTGKTLTTLVNEKESVNLDRLNYTLEYDYKKLTSLSSVSNSTNNIIDIYAESAKSFRNITVTVRTDIDDKDAWNDFYDGVTSTERRAIQKELGSIASDVSDFFDMDEEKITVLVYNKANSTLLVSYDDDGAVVKEWR